MGSQVMRWAFRGSGAAWKSVRVHAGGGEDGDFAVGEEVDVAGVVEDAGDVGGEEVFAFADAEDGGWAHAGGDELVGFVGGEDADGEGSGEALDGAADCFFEGDAVGVGLSSCFDYVGDDFGVGFGDEFVAGCGELCLEGEIVFDDAVVDDDERAGAVAVGVGVLFGGAAVGGPAGVADAEGAVDGAVGEDGLEVEELAGGSAELHAGFPSAWGPPATAMPAES